MKITVQTTKVLKQGTNDYGEWKLVKITTEDEAYTTLVDGAETLSPGTVIDITDLNEDNKGRKSFKKYEVVTEGQVLPPETRDEMTKDDWAEKQRVERQSIEAQTAFKGIITLCVIEKPTDKMLEVQEAALDWALARLKEKTTTTPTDREQAEIAGGPEGSKPEPPKEEAAPIGTEPISEPEDNLDFDVDWLKDSLERVKWKEATVKSYLKNIYQVDTQGTVIEVVARLNKEQREAFFKEIQYRLEIV